MIKINKQIKKNIYIYPQNREYSSPWGVSVFRFRAWELSREGLQSFGVLGVAGALEIALLRFQGFSEL